MVDQDRTRAPHGMMVASLGCRRCRGSAGLVPHLHLCGCVASQAEVLDTMVVGAIGVAGGIGLHEHSRW